MRALHCEPVRRAGSTRIARAHAALHEADILIEQQHFSGALNRVYYARPFTRLARCSPPEILTHLGTAASSPYSRNISFSLGSLRSRRPEHYPVRLRSGQTSDYGDFSEPSSDEVLSLRGQVEEFVRTCEQAVQKAE